MSVALDENLINRIRKNPRTLTLTFEECVAANWFWRKHVNIKILSKVFHAGKNTLYYRALTGTADSYPTSIYENQAQEVNDLVDKIGMEETEQRYVTDEMKAAVNAELALELERRDG